MTDLPTPPVDPEVDLTAFPFMPLNVRRLRDSKFAASADAEAFRTGVLLWCAAWHQVPAGSLPDDDIELATLAGFGRAVSDWQEVRSGALYGWSKHSDGRLYHRVLVQAVLEAWSRREDWQEQRQNDEDRKTRYRDRLRELSAELRALGVAIPKNRSLEVLEQLLEDTKRGRSGDAPGTPQKSMFTEELDSAGTQRGHSGDGSVDASGDSGDARGFSGDAPGMANKGTGTGNRQVRDIKNPLSPLKGGMNGAGAPRRPRPIRDQSRAAWDRVLGAIQSGHNTVGDDLIDTAVRQIGGYSRLGQSTVDQRSENRQRFRDTYEQLLERAAGEER